jgi:hypothetical protein
MGVVAHRLQQGLRALLAFAWDVDEALAAQYLNPAQMTLFQQMTRGEQLHSLQVLRLVLAQGAAPDDLAAAALLHDVGKIRYPMNVFQKTLPVLVRLVSVKLARRIAHLGEENRLARPFVVFNRHPVWSGEFVSQTGASDRLIWLVRHHADEPEVWQDHPHLELLKRLQQADNES